MLCAFLIIKCSVEFYCSTCCLLFPLPLWHILTFIELSWEVIHFCHFSTGFTQLEKTLLHTFIFANSMKSKAKNLNRMCRIAIMMMPISLKPFCMILYAKLLVCPKIILTYLKWVLVVVVSIIFFWDIFIFSSLEKLFSSEENRLVIKCW